jgi:hypothetical protein
VNFAVVLSSWMFVVEFIGWVCIYTLLTDIFGFGKSGPIVEDFNLYFFQLTIPIAAG